MLTTTRVIPNHFSSVISLKRLTHSTFCTPAPPWSSKGIGGPSHLIGKMAFQLFRLRLLIEMDPVIQIQETSFLNEEIIPHSTSPCLAESFDPHKSVSLHSPQPSPSKLLPTSWPQFPRILRKRFSNLTKPLSHFPAAINTSEAQPRLQNVSNKPRVPEPSRDQ
jgi:hypothetical protein